ncbi:guanine nucleotide-binding protein subunit gamma 1 isoform X5 [Brassica rapa]|uniref:guanine nucleotide-binding protein subunit gamma 1 isoform X5 n=1 Tax=Brassica campestris TaxID=3711 RepID=UPI000BBE338D|nr:guanine nucleotide-binding protein subunit gamma 1 isoform X5 [Brassica rapa]
MEEAASVGDAHARGKHMILAELGRVEQEVRFLENSLLLLSRKSWKSSARQIVYQPSVRSKLLCVIEKSPDPLLPLTKGPLNLGWDRWFEAPNGGERCRCFIL